MPTKTVWCMRRTAVNHPGSNLTKGTRKGRKGMDDGLDEVIPPSSLMEEHGINIFAKGE